MYDELVKRLRASVDGRYEKCDGCPYEEDYPCCVDCLDKMHKQAAEAIEELVRKEKFHAFLWNTIQPNEMEQYLAMYRAQAVPSEQPKEEA